MKLGDQGSKKVISDKEGYREALGSKNIQIIKSDALMQLFCLGIHSI